MILGASWRMNRHYRFLSYGIGFYVENNTYVKESVESEASCSHKRKWKRDEGWTQCRDCFKILETKPSLLRSLNYVAPIPETNKEKLERIGRTIIKTSFRLPKKETIEQARAKFNHEVNEEKPIEFSDSEYVKQTEKYLKGEISEDKIPRRNCSDLYNNFFKK